VNLAGYIRTVPDFPIPGILFRDITPLLRDPDALRTAMEKMAEPWQGQDVDLIAAMEARGFMFGAAMAIHLGAGFVPVRKAGHGRFLRASIVGAQPYWQERRSARAFAVRSL